MLACARMDGKDHLYVHVIPLQYQKIPKIRMHFFDMGRVEKKTCQCFGARERVLELEDDGQ